MKVYKRKWRIKVYKRKWRILFFVTSLLYDNYINTNDSPLLLKKIIQNRNYM